MYFCWSVVHVTYQGTHVYTNGDPPVRLANLQVRAASQQNQYRPARGIGICKRQDLQVKSDPRELYPGIVDLIVSLRAYSIGLKRRSRQLLDAGCTRFVPHENPISMVFHGGSEYSTVALPLAHRRAFGLSGGTKAPKIGRYCLFMSTCR